MEGETKTARVDQKSTFFFFDFFLKIQDRRDQVVTIFQTGPNIEIMMGNETDEIIDKLFSFSQNYQKDLEESMRGSNFNFDSVNILYYRLQK